MITVDLETEIAALRNSASSMRDQAKRANEEHADFKAEADQRETDMRMHIEQLEKKDIVVNGLLELMVQRTNLLQDELDR